MLLRRFWVPVGLAAPAFAAVRHFIGLDWPGNEMAGRRHWASRPRPIARRGWRGARLAAALWLLWPPQAGRAQTNSIQSQIPAAEYNALIDIYNSTGGPSWVDNTGWTNGTANYWKGVGFGSGHVFGLNLTGNGLVGTIPDSLTNLTKLGYVTLGGNQLSGTIPDSLTKCTGLEFLDLSSNQLGGTMPASLSKMTQLSTLNLASNQFSGTIPDSFGGFRFLMKLVLSNNQLTGNIPDSLGTVASLTDLELDNNQLSGSIPDSLGNLSSLNHLILCTNQLSGSLPSSLGNLVNAQSILLGHNQLSGPIPASWGQAKLQSITDLELQENQLSGTIPESWGNLISLQTLILANNQLTGSIPSSLAVYLGVLDLQDNQLSGAMPDTLGNLRELTTLRLNGNQLSGSIPSNLGDLEFLKTLDLENNQLSDEVPYLLDLTSGELNVSFNYLDIAAGSQSWSNLATMAYYGDQVFYTPQNPSPNLSMGPIILLTGGTAQVGLTGPPGTTCLIQASADLTNWPVLATVTLTNLFTNFLDPSATNHPNRFYRAVVSP